VSNFLTIVALFQKVNREKKIELHLYLLLSEKTWINYEFFPLRPPCSLRFHSFHFTAEDAVNAEKNFQAIVFMALVNISIS